MADGSSCWKLLVEVSLQKNPMLPSSYFSNIVTLAALLLITLPVGIACIVLGFGFGDNPCVLCWQERMGMILISASALFIVRYGLKPKYLGLLLVQACFGIFMSLRHSAWHIPRDVGQGFSLEILGAHTYTWGIFIYWVIIIFLGVVLFLSNTIFPTGQSSKLSKLQKTTFYTFLVVIIFNIVQAFTQTGPPPFIGHGDPSRLTYNPANWDWNLEEWTNLSKPFSFRGDFSPAPPNLDPLINYASGNETSASNLTTLKLVESYEIPKKLKGTIRDIAQNDKNKLWAIITNEQKLYVYNSVLDNLVAYASIDPLFSVDIKEYTGVSFISENRILVTTVNKSYLIFELGKKQDTKKQHARLFAESFGLNEITRDRLSTVRAKLNFITAHGRSKNEFYTITAPVKTNQPYVLSYFSLNDYKLNSERLITLKSSSSHKNQPSIISSIKTMNGTTVALNRTTQLFLLVKITLQITISTTPR